MYPFIETICIIGGKPRHLAYHEQRLNTTRQHFWPGIAALSLAPVLADAPFSYSPVKARLVYDEYGIKDKSYQSYHMRQIRSLRIVCSDDVDYPYKSVDRSCLETLFDQRQDCDDILIIKNGAVTDTSFTNVAFSDGCNWFTPNTPLLSGTMRASLLDSGVIVEKHIHLNDLSQYHSISLFNAMIEFGQLILPISRLFPSIKQPKRPL